MSHISHALFMANRDENQDITQLLGELRSGKEEIYNHLFSLIYDELHNLAHAHRRHWIGDNTLNTTALVHEAYIKLVNQAELKWNSRAHFYGVASKAMRHLLINYAEGRKRKKRGGDVAKVSLEEGLIIGEAVFDLSDDRVDMLLTLNSVLDRLAKLSERQARIVECRFFGGMDIKETAEALNVSPATVKRGWSVAQAWIYKEMNA